MRATWLYPCKVHPAQSTRRFSTPLPRRWGVGYFTGATTTGVLSPAAFSVDGRDTTLTGLKWQSGSVVLSLSPFASLGDNQLSFIDVDGSLALALGASAATADIAGGHAHLGGRRQALERG